MAQIVKPSWLLHALILKKVLYMGQEKYLISRSGIIDKADENFKGKAQVVILGKEFYFEAVQTFPFLNLRDIRSAVKMDMETYSPFNTSIFFARKIAEKGDHAIVNLWFVDPGVVERVQEFSPYLVIPETALLCLHQDSRPAIYVVNRLPAKRLLLYSEKNGAVKSLLSPAGEPDLENFRRCMGREAKDCPVKQIEDMKKYCGLLHKIFFDTSIMSLSFFLTLDSFSSNIEWSILKKGLTAALLLLFMYASLYALLPYYEMKSLAREDSRLSAGLSFLLEKEKRIKDLCRRQKIFAEKINNYTYKLPVIMTISSILPRGSIIRELTIAGNKVVMKGTAPKASEVLASLNRAKNVGNAGFSSPVRQERKSKMEIFTIAFEVDKIEL
ncbi:hypothetical protein DRQ26_03030 [bacterium]|nr:MAG: hypothetical protein DRQ26_03030 [bacterium]